jgi:undecaprenyl diphosphate synthase
VTQLSPAPTAETILAHGTVPRHIAVIMDGNGRWAKQRGWLRPRGHRAGADAVVNCVEACQAIGVDFLTLYAFSTENWKRPAAEVEALMLLLEKFLKEKTATLMEKNVRLQAIGRLHLLPAHCRKQLEASIAQTSQNTGLTMVLALSYGAREEILDAVQSLLDEARAHPSAAAPLTAEQFSERLYTRAYPDPELLVRTSGEMRISNFLLWQISYAELVVLDRLWPDFSHADLFDAVAQFQQRTRRFGGI